MNSPLRPMRYAQGELFVIDALDVAIRSDMPSMEHPFYGLSKTPEKEIKRHEYKDSWIEYRPSHKGLPTIYDQDLIIYAISHSVNALGEGHEPPKEFEIDPYYFLQFCQRGTGGREYEALNDTIERLDGSRFRSNTRIGNMEFDSWTGLVDSAKMITEIITDPKTGKETKQPRKIHITLSNMVINSIRNGEVLALNKDYFRLKKATDRRIYQIVRKHCGKQRDWTIGIRTLHEKSGSKSSLSEFRRTIKPLLEGNHLPDYSLFYNPVQDNLTFTPRKEFLKAIQVMEPQKATLPKLPEYALEKAREAAPRMDIHMLEAEWRAEWLEKGAVPPKNLVGAFVGYCKKSHKATLVDAGVDPQSAIRFLERNKHEY